MRAVSRAWMRLRDIAICWTTAEHDHFHLSRLVRRCIAQSKDATQQNNAWIDVTIDPMLPRRFAGDAKLVERILCNLLTNAIECSNGNMIQLLASASRHPTGLYDVMISIADQGKGISPASETASEQSAGVEMTPQAIRAARLAESQTRARQLDGDIRLQNWDGVGTDFTLILPLRAFEGA